ncbi:Rid family hydrolase [Oceanicola sp. S124]|uniref:Rid family hydrolase n=1 Tax=Oceanicola sp. S124 TaxID=1042378 RepID=UPI00025585E1|nr:Rid family hydrolase [Oceanicola sp. S124]
MTTLTRSHTETMDGAKRSLVCKTGAWTHFIGLQPRNLDGDIKEQAADVVAQLEALLEEAGLAQQDLFTVTIWLKDMRYFSALNAVWNGWVDDANPPARTCVSGELYRPDLLLEVVAVAYKSEVAA